VVMALAASPTYSFGRTESWVDQHDEQAAAAADTEALQDVMARAEILKRSDLLHDTVDLFATIDALPTSPKMTQPDVSLQQMLEECSYLMGELETRIGELRAEMDNAVSPRLLLESQVRIAVVLSGKTKEIINIWQARPERHRRSDFYSLLEQQLKEADDTINDLELRISLIRAKEQQLEDVHDKLYGDLEAKRASLEVDQQALFMTLSDEPTDRATSATPLSTHLHSAWLSACKAKLEESESCLELSVETRQEACEMQVVREMAMAQAAKEVVEALLARIKEWRRVIPQLPPRIAEVLRTIEQLQDVLRQVPARREVLQSRAIRAEQRLALRNTREADERKSDVAEEAIVTELDEVRQILNALEEKRRQLEAEIPRLIQEICKLETELKDAQDALASDEFCLKMQYKSIPQKATLTAEASPAKSIFSPPGTLPLTDAPGTLSPRSLKSPQWSLSEGAQ